MGELVGASELHLVPVLPFELVLMPQLGDVVLVALHGGQCHGLLVIWVHLNFETLFKFLWSTELDEFDFVTVIVESMTVWSLG